MKNLYINKRIGKTLMGLLLVMGLGSCTVYSQGQQQYPNTQYPNNTVYNNQQSNGNYDNNYDDGYYDNSNEPEITYDNFYSALSPYGTWMNYGGYGQVWVCSDPNFRPYYSNGGWVNTNLGWSWNSGYSWGWAPFHYGRWGFASNIGWYWIPGYQWAPAWVYWGNASNNYAWAPVGPGMSLGINISIGSIPTNYWTYMPGRYMGYSNINRYCIPVTQNNVYIRNTTIINNYNVVNNNVRYSAGPRATDVSRFTGRPVNTVRVVQSNNASNNGRVSNGTMSVYRPGRNAGANANQGNNGRNNPGRNNNGTIDNNNSNNRGGFGGRTSTNNGNTNPTNTAPNTNNNNYNRGSNNPNWNNRGNNNNDGTNRNGNNQPTNNVQPTTPTTGTNNSTINRPNTNNNNNTQTRWGSWNRGGSGNATNNANTNQPVTNNNWQNRQQNATPQQSAPAPANTNRGNWQQPNSQRSNNNATFSGRATSTTQPVRTQNFNGGRFGRTGNGRR